MSAGQARQTVHPKVTVGVRPQARAGRRHRRRAPLGAVAHDPAEGLEQRGQNLYAQGINTGLPIEGGPGENGIGKVVAGALELSNTDIGGDLVNLVLASTQYRSNARVITATQQLFDELLNIRR